MLVGVKLTVNISRDQSCFAYINSKYENANSPNETNCIQVQVGENHVYLWTVFRSSVPEGWILVNPVLCMLLGMTLGTDVYVNTSSNIRKLDSLYIEADGKEDQLILELNHTSLQSVILDQVRLVVAHQKAVIWLSRSMPIVFTPLQTGILVNHTQVIVRSIAIKSPQRLSVNPKVEEQMKNTYNAMKGLLRPLFRLPKRMALRALPIGDGKKDLLHPYTVFMHEELVEEKFRSSPLILALMNNMPTLIENKEEGEMFWRHEICVEVVPVNSVVFRSLCREVYSQHIPTVLIPKSLNNIIHANNGAMVMLTFIDSKTLNQPQHIEITTYTAELKKESEQSLIEKFKSLVVQNTYSGKAFVINHDMIKQNKLLTTGFIKFRLSPAGLIYTTLTQETFRLCSISAKMLNISDLRPQYPVVQLDYDYKNYCRTIKPLELLLERVMSHIYFDIHREAKFYKCSDLKSGVLITGLNGTGKSTICNLVEKEISVYTYILQCRAVKGRKDINTILSRALYICRGRKPSLMILDDLDDLVPASMEGLSPQDIASYNTLALDIKHKIGMAAGVSLLITARSVNSLHPIFRMFTGQPMFTAQFNMPELAQEDRVQLFQHLLNPKVREQFEVDVDDAIRLAMETNGSNIMQMLDYFKKKIYIAIKKKCAYRDAPKPRIVEDVTKDVARVKQFDVWGPIGGLESVKEKLNECIFWPILYPALFPSQSCGILLYGPPGTGKSLIGSCLAKMSNMNMITVKGPELLSKYIGQSEAAVREVFDKADMKRPCILFFDEFDSLAPRRGHDSTGVTDRVVNQLLARLDGAEGGARGPVLAATSRPDLLDPALLRQGRLSTHLYTEMPGLDGRYEVLRNLSRDFNVNPGVDLQAVAEQTEGYSPADLRSLLVAAQLSRLDLELLRVRVTDDDDEPTQGTVVIDTDDINNALAETKPSLNAQQRKFFEFVYRRFRGERPAGDDMPSRDRSGMRVTLA